jgi:hypothetical protein
MVVKPWGARRPPEADVPDYSLDTEVICNRAQTVDLRLANDFHFENNCAGDAVTSREGS